MINKVLTVFRGIFSSSVFCGLVAGFALPTSGVSAKNTPFSAPTPTVAETSSFFKHLANISTPEKAYKHLSFLAHDSLKGRNTPSPELEKAAEYIADHFKKSGVQPVNGTYFQKYALVKTNLKEKPTMSIVSPSGTYSLTVRDEFVPIDQTGGGKLENTSIAFAGYGITAKEYQYDDYKDIDVRGKIVVIFRGEPTSPTDSTYFLGKTPTKHSRQRLKVENAIKHGAAGIILLAEPTPGRKMRPFGFPWPVIYPSMPASALPVTLPKPGIKLIPAVSAGEQTLQTLFGSADRVALLLRSIDTTRQPKSYIIDSCKASMNVELVVDSTIVRNVMGVVRGTKKPDEYVVLGAHYDHIGHTFSKKDTTSDESKKVAVQDTIFNGADDNASGTTGILLLAEAFATAQVKPERSILLVAFSGEEKGLLGSKAFVDNSPIDVAKYVAMLNMDMIGRNDTTTLSIGGDTRCKELAQLNARLNSQLTHPFSISYDIEQFFFRSDQANFAMKKIPVLFYYTGEHADYHKVGDEIHKINFTKLSRVAELCGRTAWETSNYESRFPYTPSGDEEE